MKITKEVIVPEHKKTITLTVCDVCHEEFSGQEYQCGLCLRTICSKCLRKYYPDDSDYPYRRCPTCYHLEYEVYKKAFETITEEAWAREEALRNKIKEESLSHA